MSYAMQPYNANNGALVNQPFNRVPFGSNTNINADDLLGPLLGLANQLMGDILRNTHGLGGLSPFMGLDRNSSHPKIVGMSAMNVTQITRGPDGRPHIIQAHNERRMGPNGVWQTKKALRDPDRGIEKVQIGYFTGDHGKIIERRLDRATGQYHQEIQRRGITPTDLNYSPRWPAQAPLPLRQQSPLSLQQYPYCPQHQHQQQCPFYSPQRQQAPPPYVPQPLSALSSYSHKAQQALPTPPPYPYI